MTRGLAPLGLAAGLLVAWGGCRCGGGPSRPSSDGPAVVLVDPDEAQLASAEPEQEPNNSRAKAQALLADRAVGGTLTASPGDGGAGGDEDWYRVAIDTEGVLSAAVSGVAAIDLVLEAFSEAGQRLVKVDNHQVGGGETLVNLAVTPGRYFLRVRGRPSKLTPPPAPQGRARPIYRVSYSTRPREPSEELEPNWKAALATELEMGGEAVGYLGWHTDTDWYRVAVGERPAGSLLRVEFDGVDGVPAQLSVHDSKSTLIQRRRGGAGEPVALANLALPAAEQTVFVVVRCGRRANIESQYALRVSIEAAVGATEIEPNDSPARATALVLGKVVRGNLGSSRDIDLFAVDGELATQVVAFPPPGVDLALGVVDSAGKVRWEVDAARAGRPEALPVAQLGTERLIRVRAKSGNDIDPGASYRLIVRRRSAGLWEQEPNDKLPAASTPALGPGAPLRGFLHPAKDVDHIGLACPTTGAVLRLVGKRRPKQLALLDAGGKVLASSPSADGEGNLTLSLPAVAGGGRCWLRLAEGAGGAPETDAYELILGVSQVPPASGL